jgi:hypothetical protein
MVLPETRGTVQGRPVHKTLVGGWLIGLPLVSLVSFVGFVVIATIEAGPFFQNPRAVVLLLIAVASLLVASIVAISAAMKRRTRSRLPSPTEAAQTGITPVICAMGVEHPDVFSARMCDIGSLDDACSTRLERIADDHPDRVTRQEAAERLKTHRGWDEASPVPSLWSTGRSDPAP